jgi:hypothetical protein
VIVWWWVWAWRERDERNPSSKGRRRTWVAKVGIEIQLNVDEAKGRRTKAALQGSLGETSGQETDQTRTVDEAGEKIKWDW